MEVKYGKGKTEYGTGVEVNLTGDEVATAIYAYLSAHKVYISGAATIKVNGELCKKGKIYIDPSAFIVYKGIKYLGNNKSTK